MKVIVFGDISSVNLGDPLLTYSTSFLVKKIRNEASLSKISDIITADLAYRANQESASKAVKLENNDKTAKQPNFVTLKSWVKWILKEKKRFLKYLEEIGIESGDKVIVAGGALFSHSVYYALRLGAITKIANRKNAEIAFNAIGVEKSRGVCISHIIIRRFLKNSSVKVVSTRDHVEEICKLTSNFKYQKYVPDAALWAAQAFETDRRIRKDGVVGIGVISLQAYRSVSNAQKQKCSMTIDKLLSFYEKLIFELDKKKIPWKVFTNGAPADNAIAETLFNKYHYDRRHLVPYPKSPGQLVQILSEFNVVIAHRLHALIVSTSLEIPVVPLIWSDKVLTFAKQIGCENSAFRPEENDVESIIKAV